MTPNSRSVALLAGNPALAAIHAQALQQDGGFTVRWFETIEALSAYLQAGALDLLVLDTDGLDAVLVDNVRTLSVAKSFRLLALKRANAPLVEDVSEVLVKPVTPAQLLARVNANVKSRRVVNGQPYRGVERRKRTRSAMPHPVMLQRQGNVIPLFGEGRMPR